MAWTSNHYYKNWKQKDLYKIYYLVDTINKRILDKQTLRIDTLQYTNSKLPIGQRWIAWINAQQYQKKLVTT